MCPHTTHTHTHIFVMQFRPLMNLKLDTIWRWIRKCDFLKIKHEGSLPWWRNFSRLIKILSRLTMHFVITKYIYFFSFEIYFGRMNIMTSNHLNFEKSSKGLELNLRAFCLFLLHANVIPLQLFRFDFDIHVVFFLLLLFPKKICWKYSKLLSFHQNHTTNETSCVFAKIKNENIFCISSAHENGNNWMVFVGKWQCITFVFHSS